MVKVFKGFRFDPELYESFKQVADVDRLTITEAFERYMKASIESGTVKLPLAEGGRRSGIDAEARVLLDWLRRGQTSYSMTSGGDEIGVRERLLQMLSQVEDEALRKEIEEQLKKG